MSTNQIVPHNPLEGSRPEIVVNLHSGSEEQVSIVVVHKDRPEYLNICLQSIAVTSFNNNYELIVVDNGSGKESLDYLDSLGDEVKVVRNEKNLYWAVAANKGAQAADKNSKYIIFLHCDVVVLNPAWIDLLINVSESQNAGMVGVELQSYFMQQQKVDFVQEYCVLFTRECWETIGPWDARYNPAAQPGKEFDGLPQIGTSFIMTMKAQMKGFKPQVMKNPIIHHYKIFSLDINEYEKLTERAMSEIPRMLRDVQTQAV
jgi:glycosyltransferase involved in cell wall biosynthesis